MSLRCSERQEIATIFDVQIILKKNNLYNFIESNDYIQQQGQ